MQCLIFNILLYMILWHVSFHFKYVYLTRTTAVSVYHTNIRARKADGLWRHEFAIYGYKLTIQYRFPYMVILRRCTDRLLFEYSLIRVRILLYLLKSLTYSWPVNQQNNVCTHLQNIISNKDNELFHFHYIIIA